MSPESTSNNFDDNINFRTVVEAMKTIGIDDSQQREIIEIVGSVLLMGNIVFRVDDSSNTIVYENEAIHSVSKIMGVDLDTLKASLTSRTIDAHGEQITSPLDQEMSFYARDALAKAIYSRLFDWLVDRINLGLQTDSSSSKSSQNHVMGILDIYGFEVFDTNSFEQLW